MQMGSDLLQAYYVHVLLQARLPARVFRFVPSCNCHSATIIVIARHYDLSKGPPIERSATTIATTKLSRPLDCCYIGGMYIDEHNTADLDCAESLQIGYTLLSSCTIVNPAQLLWRSYRSHEHG